MSAALLKCPSLSALEDRARGAGTSPELEEHLGHCETCREALRRIRQDNEFLGSFAVNGAFPPLAAAARPEIEIPGYEIVREIHRGGQGVVYQARQRSTKRDVAIKVMKQGPFATLSDRARFEREIQTLGRLNHPNIVAVHDAGAAGGFSYFVMNYVDGQPLDEAVHPSRSSVEAMLSIFGKVCDAVHAAHLRGVIHRDLKPSNIRVDREGEPHVLDFGLAKSENADGETAMTHTGQFVGSLPWASPEQVEGAGEKIDLRTDVYSLGAMLFQLVTGRLPFEVGGNLRSAVDRILLRPPPRPSSITHGLRIDEELDTIILKCLSKDRERRYQSAGELAADLRRYQAGEAIEAKRDSAVYLLRKTLHRYRWPFGVATAFVILVCVFGVVMAWLYRRSAGLEQQAVRSATALSQMLSQSNIEQGRMAGVLGNLAQAEQLLWRELLMNHEKEGALNAPPGPPEAYWALWELYRRHPCLRTLTPTPAALRTVTVGDDGRSIWLVDPDGMVRRLSEFGGLLESYRVNGLWLPAAAFVHRSGAIVCGLGPRSALWHRGHGEEPLLTIPESPNLDNGGFCLAGSGQRFAMIDNGVARIWNIEPLTEVAHFEAELPLSAVGLSNDERRLAARDRMGGLWLWEVESRRLLARLAASSSGRAAPHAVGQLLFSPDDRWLADAWMETSGRIWDLSTDPPTPTELSERPGEYRCQCFSPDGRMLAIGDIGGTLRLFETASAQRLTAFAAHPGRIRSVAFTGDGRGVWTSSEGELRLWEVGADAGVRMTPIRGEQVHSIDVSRDGRLLLAGGGLGKLHVGDGAAWTFDSRDFGNKATLSGVAIAPDGRHVAASTHGGVAYVWDSPQAEQPALRLAHPQAISHVRFSPDGTRIATACDDGGVRIWDAASGALQAEYHWTKTRVPHLAFDPSGERLAIAARDGALRVANLASGACEDWSPASASALRDVEFSADGRWLIAGGADRAVQIWDAATRKPLARLMGHNQEIYCLDISPDGGMIASGDSGGAIRLWHFAKQRPLATLTGHRGGVMVVRFTPDGRRLLSGGLDGSIREWDLSYYDGHIAGQVEAQLQRLGPFADEDSARTWREWARQQAAAEHVRSGIEDRQVARPALP